MAMMDREKVIKALEYCITGDCGSCFYRQQCIKTGIKRDALALLKEQKEVVRCKDCKYWLPMDRFHQDYHPGYGECELNCWVRQMDWFCADGERKSD